MLLLLTMFLVIFLSINYMVRNKNKPIILFAICVLATVVFILQLFNIFFYQSKRIILDDDVLLVLSTGLERWEKIGKTGF